MEAEERHLTVDDLARSVGLPKITIYKWNFQGTGPRFMRFGKHVRYKITDVAAWEAEQYVVQAEGSPSR